MTNSMKLATTVAVAAFVVGALSLPANALDFTSILQNLSRGVSSWNELDARQNELSAQLTAAAGAGQLSATEAEGFKSELTRVMQVEAQIKASGRQLSATDAISFTNSLNNLTNRINLAIQSKSNSTAASLAAVESLRAQLRTQLTEARTARTIPRNEFEIIKDDLDHNANIQNAFTISGDTLTARQAQVLSEDLAKIRVAIHQNITVVQTGVPQLTNQRAVIEQKIAAGIAGRTIREYQAADLRKELDQIAKMQTDFLSIDGVLTPNEVLAIASELDRLSTRLDYHISMGTNESAVNTSYHGNNGYGRNNRRNEHPIQELDERRAQLLVRLNTAQNTRKISRFEASKLRSELDLIAQYQAQSKLSGGGRLSYEQSAKIRADLTNFQQKLDTQLTARANSSRNYR